MKSTRTILAAMLAAMSLGPFAYADELARVPLNGKTVILDTNGTWSYAPDGAAPAAASNCSGGRVLDSKKLPLSLCLPDAWKLVDTNGASFEIEAVNADTDTYVGVITERTIMSAENLRDAILYNASKAADVQKQDVPIVSETKEQLGGKPWDLMVYDVNFNGSKFRFGNYYRSLGDLGAVQLVFWCSQPYYDQVKGDIAKVAAGLSFTKDVP